jgi:hypothetical protein
MTMCIHTQLLTLEYCWSFNWEFFNHFLYGLDLSAQIPYVCLPEELVAITALQKY